MKDYAKVINQSKEMHGQRMVKETLTKSAVDKNKEREPAPHKKGASSGFFTMIAIFVIIAILFAVYRQYMHPKGLLNPKAQQEETQEQAPQQAASPQFDFYTVLPNGTTPGANPSSSSTGTPPTTVPATATTTPVTTPADSTAATPTTPAPATTTSAAPSGQYYLVAGSFANSADAQQMLSQLLLLGVQANVKTNQENGEPSYQVLVGPFDDQDAMTIVRNQLAVHQIQASVIQQ